MSIRFGRAVMTRPIGATPFSYTRKDAVDGSIAGPYYARGFEVTGRESDAASQTTLDVLEKEAERFGSVYVKDDDALLPEGYYDLSQVAYEKPGGAPKLRPWQVSVTKRKFPVIARQAEDDKLTGTITADSTADEGNKVVYTPTTSDVAVLAPRTLTTPEPLNLPAGDWVMMLRCQSRTTTSQKFRGQLTPAASDAPFANGSQKTVSTAGTWTELNLGTFTVADDANAGSNWFRVLVQGVVAELNDVWLDRVRFYPA